MRAFYNLHPSVSAVYYLSVLAVAMFIQNPFYQLCAVAGGVLFLCCLHGVFRCIKELAFFVPVAVLVSVLNPFFSHNGATPLFFINDNAYTLEALVCGIGISLMLLSVVIWFKTFDEVFDSEKLLFLIGKISPKISMIFSMTLGFIPRLIKNFKEILSAQKMFCEKSKLKLYLSCFSAVVTHTIENTVDTADSMSARGYGVRRPAVFSRFLLKGSDIVFLIIVLSLSVIICIPGALWGTVIYYPQIRLPRTTAWMLASYAGYFALCILPFCYEVLEELKWKYSVSKI